MSETTAISWTDSTWNPWQGCLKVSPGCDHCYAETLSTRWSRDFSDVHLSRDKTFHAPRTWQRKVELGLLPNGHRIFTCSISDFFIRQADPWRALAWKIMAETPDLTYQVLTKRPSRAVAWYQEHGWLPNVWLGTSVESAKYLPRLTVLARVPAKVRFVSAEPLLKPLELRPYIGCGECANNADRDIVCGCGNVADPPGSSRRLNWVIVGGESGPGHRPMQVEWVQDIAGQCREAGVPLFVKQDSGPRPGQQGRISDALWARKEKPC